MLRSYAIVCYLIIWKFVLSSFAKIISAFTNNFCNSLRKTAEFKYWDIIHAYKKSISSLVPRTSKANMEQKIGCIHENKLCPLLSFSWRWCSKEIKLKKENKLFLSSPRISNYYFSIYLSSYLYCWNEYPKILFQLNQLKSFETSKWNLNKPDVVLV